MPIDTSRRGRHAVGPDLLEFAAPFGLRRIALARREPALVLVVPRVTPVSPLPVASFTTDGMLGERAGQEQMIALREYVVGDPLKLVHWKASAHLQTLMVRHMVDPCVPSVLVVLDVDASSYPQAGSLFADFSPDAFEAAVDLAASHAWSNCLPGRQVLLTTTAGEGPVVSGSVAGRDAVVDALALVEACSSNRCLPGRVVAIARQRSVGQVLVVTGAGHAGSRAPVGGIAPSLSPLGMPVRIVTVGS